MTGKTNLQKYIDYFSVQTGGAPKQERLEWAIRETLSDDALSLFFLLPAYGSITPIRLEKRALRKGFTSQRFQECLSSLHTEGFLIRYDKRGQGQVYERAFVSFTVEQQVRRRKGTELGAAYGEFWDGLSELTSSMPSKTPYFRVLAVEDTLPAPPTTQIIPVGEAVADPRMALPIDIISQMVSREPLIGVSECYCRLARENRGGGSCAFPRETCFTFNELAQTLIETGLARQVDAGEAIEILRNAEINGLVHNVDNCQGQLKALCNCCPCCCPAIKSYKAGVRNVNAASRYIAFRLDQHCSNCGECIRVCPVEALSAGNGTPLYDPRQCIGCGLCASHCPEKAIEMRLRDELPKIPKTNSQLWASIRNEAIVTMAKNSITSLFKPKGAKKMS